MSGTLIAATAILGLFIAGSVHQLVLERRAARTGHCMTCGHARLPIINGECWECRHD